jgi:hypothetical protein
LTGIVTWFLRDSFGMPLLIVAGVKAEVDGILRQGTGDAILSP